MISSLTCLDDELAKEINTKVGHERQRMVRTTFNVSIYLESFSICFLYLRTESYRGLVQIELKIQPECV